MPVSIRSLGRRDVASTFPIPPSASESPSAAASAATQVRQDFTWLIVAGSFAGSVALVFLLAWVYLKLRERADRRIECAPGFLVARKLDPDMSWREYKRSQKMCESTRFLDEESLRATIISKSRKSSNSRHSLNPPDQHAVLTSPPHQHVVFTDPGVPPSLPTPTRAPVWSRGRQRTRMIELAPMATSDVEDKEMLLPSSLSKPQLSVSSERANSTGSADSSRSPGQGSAHSSRRWIWELPDGKKCPPAWGNGGPRWSGGSVKDAPPAVPLPSMRSRTPPLWAHPPFRPEGSGMGIISKSFTNDTGLLPSERTKRKPTTPC